MGGNTKARESLRQKLRSCFGDACYWCGHSMKFAELGKFMDDMPNMATIEHHIAKEKGDKNQMLYLRLSHKRCNK